jgi:acetate---CoA ligase (ADP-forming)
MLDALFRPRAVAVVGASRDERSIGHVVLRNLVDHGFVGGIFAVNPAAETILERRAYPSLLAIPEPIDLVNIAVGYERVPAVIEECGRKGVKFAVVHSAGFRETGPAGAAREVELVALARRSGVRLCGPNCQGVQNSDAAVKLYANFTFTPMRPGTVSILAQSGGLGEIIKLHLLRAGLGHRLYASYGNESDVSLPELLDYCGADEGTGVIALQVESLRDAHDFLAVARRIGQRKPIVALKSGRTPQGALAASTHTGTLADESALATALFKKCGVLSVDDTEALVQTATVLAAGKLPRGGRLAVVSNTGGPAVQAVDVAIEERLSLARWTPETEAQLATSLHAEACRGNPLDLLATATPVHYAAALRALLGDDGVDMVLVSFVTPLFVDALGIGEEIQRAAASSSKPLVCAVYTLERWAGLVDALRAGGVPVYDFPEPAVRALAATARLVEQRTAVESPPRLLVDRATAARVLARGGSGYLSQLDAFVLLASYGVPIPKVARVRGVEDLPQAAARVGFPCVLKIDSPTIVHKAAAGGVATQLRDALELEGALAAMRGRFPDVELPFILLEQRPAGRELIVGGRTQPGVGALLMLGLGGVLVEALRDVSFALGPLARAEARQMLRELRSFAALTAESGAPGGAGIDDAALVEIVVRVARLLADFPQIDELDLNPVIAYPAGTASVAVDVRVKLAASPEAAPASPARAARDR